MKIKQLIYDYTPTMCTNTQGIGEQSLSAEVGVNGVTEITEHAAAGDGDKWYYDIHYNDGVVVRTFNPHKVYFTK